jgi:hypothetical protein
MVASHFTKARLLTLALIALWPLIASPALAKNSLVTFESASVNGLERSWFSHVQVDSARHRVEHWLLEGENVFALTSSGTLHALNAETGESLWVAEAGDSSGITTGFAAAGDYVALLTATRLHLIDRHDGHRIWSRRVGGPPSASPALSATHVWVSLLSGRVEAYPIENPTELAWQYQSSGRIFLRPTVTGDVVSWPTDRGFLYVGQANDPRVLYRIETNDEIVTPAIGQTPYLYSASIDGNLYALNEVNGAERWRYATGYAVTSPPALVEDRAFVASEGPSLHAVDLETGRRAWVLDGASQFVARGGHYTYALDPWGTLYVLDSQTGGVAGTLAAGTGMSAIVNDQSDRIFLVNDTGLIQCLHEIGADEPTWYQKAATPAVPSDSEAATEEQTPAETAPVEAAPDRASPFETFEAPPAGDNPFEDDDDDSSQSEPENPFGGFNPFDN